MLVMPELVGVMASSMTIKATFGAAGADDARVGLPIAKSLERIRAADVTV